MRDGEPLDPLRARIAVPFVLTALIWGSTWLAIKDQLGDVPPSWSIAYRFVTVAVGMAILVRIKGQGFRLDRAGHTVSAIFGLTQFCLNFNLLYRAEAYLTSGLVAVLFGLLMLPNVLLARVFLRQRVTPAFIAGTLVALGGIVLLVLNEVRMAPLHGPAGGNVPIGLALTAGAILAASSANVMQAAEAARRQPILTMLAWALAWGALGDCIVAWLISGPPLLPADIRYWGGVFYLGILGSVVTFPLYFQLVRELGPGRAAYNGVVVPIVAMLLSTLFEAYRWSLLAGCGAALALLGMVLALKARNPSR